MATVNEIANMALLRVGAEAISDITDSNNRAEACNTAWPFVRRDVLRQHSWNAATVRATLSESVGDPTWEFASSYDLPADCLHMMEVDTNYDWRVENGELVTEGSGDVNVRYIKDETDTSVYDSNLTMVMVLRLAVEIAERITGNRAKRELLLQEYLQALNEAMMSDGEESSNADFEEDDWIKARYY